MNYASSGSFAHLPTRNNAQQAGMSRAISAGVLRNNPKLQRYEEITSRMKRMAENEKRNLRGMKTMVANEIENRNFLEKMLRQCIDDVRAEITKKRAEFKTSQYSNHGKKPARASTFVNGRNLMNAERDKIIEVLLS